MINHQTNHLTRDRQQRRHHSLVPLKVMRMLSVKTIAHLHSRLMLLVLESCTRQHISSTHLNMNLLPQIVKLSNHHYHRHHRHQKHIAPLISFSHLPILLIQILSPNCRHRRCLLTSQLGHNQLSSSDTQLAKILFVHLIRRLPMMRVSRSTGNSLDRVTRATVSASAVNRVRRTV